MLAVLHVIPFPMESICRIRQVMSSYWNISNIFVIHTCSNGRIVKISGRLPAYVPALVQWSINELWHHEKHLSHSHCHVLLLACLQKASYTFFFKYHLCFLLGWQKISYAVMDRALSLAFYPTSAPDHVISCSPCTSIYSIKESCAFRSSTSLYLLGKAYPRKPAKFPWVWPHCQKLHWYST